MGQLRLNPKRDSGVSSTGALLRAEVISSSWAHRPRTVERSGCFQARREKAFLPSSQDNALWDQGNGRLRLVGVQLGVCLGAAGWNCIHCLWKLWVSVCWVAEKKNSMKYYAEVSLLHRGVLQGHCSAARDLAFLQVFTECLTFPRDMRKALFWEAFLKHLI